MSAKERFASAGMKIGNATINGLGVQIPVVTAKTRNIEKQALTIPLSNARLKV